MDRLGDKVERTGRRVGGLTGTIGRPLLALAGAGGVGALIGSSVKLAASFETTMRQVAVATNEPASKLKDLSDLALKMGADTTFSAKEAGDAMLELAKGGLTSAEIKGGALGSTLTLAAAGGLELGNAAGYIVQGLRTFNLGAGKAAEVAAALAGGANASTASVEDMGLALSQVGPGAVTAGLSLQETTAVLAAFAQNGIKGSDAGTSLKTMLTRLIPTTDKAKGLMEDLGLSFVDAKGNFKNITQIAQNLQDSLGGLTAARRKAALATIFGSDAERAATILTKEGAKGLEKFIRATNDKTQADKLAKAATSGTAGALEQMRGSIETAQIALGTALAPAVVDVAKKVSAFANGPLTHDIIPAISSFVQGMREGEGPGGKFADVVGELGDAAGTAWSAAKPLFGFIGDHPKLFAEVAKDAVIFAGAMKALSLVRGLKGGVSGVVGSAVGKAPIPVLVTNPGFGAPGAPGTTGTGGKGGTPPAVAAGKLALPASFVGLLPDVRDSRDIINDVQKPLVRLVANEVLTAALKGLISKNQGNAILKATQKGDLGKAYDFLVKYGSKTEEVKEQIAALAKDPRVAAALKERARQAARNVELISAGFLKTEHQAKVSADKMGLALGNGVGKGVRYALDKADGLDTNLTHLGQKKVEPKVKLGGAAAASKDAVDLFLKLNRVGAQRPLPIVRTSGISSAISKAQALRAQLAWLDGRTVNTTVGVRIRTDNDLPLPVGVRVPGNATGGWVDGFGTGTSDSNLRRLSNGEFVVNARDAKANADTLEAINAGRTPTAVASGPTYGDVYITVPDKQTALSVPMQLRQDAWLKGL